MKLDKVRGAHFLLAAVPAVLLSVPVAAQTTPEPTASVQSFTAEYPVALTSINSNVQPNIPPNLLASITGGALEIRQQVSWPVTSAMAPGTNHARVLTFLVAPGSPEMTPPAGQNLLIDSHIVSIQSSAVSTTPTNAVAMMGTVVANDPVTPFGNATGALWSFSAGYTTGTPARFRNITVAVAGIASWYTSSGTGSISFTGGTDGGPGEEPGGNRPPTADAGADFSTLSLQVQLNGSNSSDPDNDELTYSWVVSGRSATILQSNTNRPIVQFGGGLGDYVFQLTVTDPSGASSTDTVTVMYLGR